MKRLLILSFLLLSLSHITKAQFTLELAGEIPAQSELSDAIIIDNYLLGVTNTEPYYFEVWDISDLQNPINLQRIEQANDLRPDNMVRSGNVVYLDGDGNSFDDTFLDVWDITNITNPSLIRSYATFPWNGSDKRISEIVESTAGEFYARVGVFDIARFNAENPSNIFIIGGSGDSFNSSSISGMDNFQLINENAGWFDRNDFSYATVNADGSMTRLTDARNNLTGELYDFDIYSDEKTAFAVTWTTGPLYLASVDLNGPNDVQELNLYDVGDSITAGFNAILIADEERDLVFIGGEVSFVMVDVSNRLDPKIISKHTGADNFLRQFGEYIVTDQFASGSETLIYRINDFRVIADFTANTNKIFEGDNVNFTDNSNGGPTSWSWSFPGGTPATSDQQNPTVSYSTSGTYDVTLTVSNGEFSSTETKTAFVEVLPEGFVEADFTYDASVINEKETVSFQNTSFGEITSYLWTFEGGTPETSTLENPTVLYNTPGVYGVSLTVNSASETDIKELQNIITVNDVKTCEGNITINNSTGTLTDGSGEDNYDNDLNCSWLFDVAAGSKIRLTLNELETEENVDFVRIYDGSNNSAPLLASFSGVYNDSTIQSSGENLYLEFTADGANNFPGWSFSYEELKPIQPEFTADKTSISKGESIQFEDLSEGEAISWNWSFPGGTPATSTEQNPMITYETAGIFSVSLEVSDGEATKTITKLEYIEVFDAPLAAQFSSDLRVIEQNGSVNFNNESTGSPTSYSWVFEGGIPRTSQEQNPTVNYPSTGSYAVKLTAFRGSDDSTTVVDNYITVSSPNNNIIPAFKANTYTVFEGESINFQDVSTGNPTNWLWSFEGAASTSSSTQNPIVTYNNAGTYTVSLTASNDSIERTVVKEKIITVLNSTGIEYADNVFSSTFNSPGLAFDSFYGGNCNDGENPAIADSINIVSGNNSSFVTIPNGSSITLEFLDNEVINAPNQDDIFIKECSPNDEYAEVYVSNNKINFVFLGIAYASSDGPSKLSFDLDDINFPSSVKAIKIVGKDLNGPSQGFDLQAVYGAAGANKAINEPLEAKFVANNQDIAVGEQVSFTDLSNGQPVSYSWFFEGGTPSTSNLSNPSVTYQEGGIYNVTLTVTKSGQQNTATYTDYITVYDPSSCGNTNILSNDSGTIEDGSGELNYGNNIDCSWLLVSSDVESYALTINTLDTESGADVLRIYDGADDTAELLAEFSGLLNDTTVVSSRNVVYVSFITDNSTTAAGWSLNYEEAIIADFEAEATEVIQGNSLNFISNSTGPISSWEWTFEQGTPQSSNIENPTVEYNEEGSFDVTLTVRKEGVENTIIKENYVTVLSFLLSNKSKESIDLYPNPTTKWVYIDNLEVKSVKVYSANGSLLIEKKSNNIDISELEDGVYSIVIVSKSGQTYNAKILKK